MTARGAATIAVAAPCSSSENEHRLTNAGELARLDFWVEERFLAVIDGPRLDWPLFGGGDNGEKAKKGEHTSFRVVAHQ